MILTRACAARRMRVSWQVVSGLLPAEFPEPVVVDAEMVGDLVDDGTADLVSDLLFGAAGRADRLAVDGDAVGQHSRVLRRAAGERDALVEPEQARRSGAMLTVTATLRISWPSSSGSPSSAVMTISETAGFDLDHQPIVQRSAAARVSPGAARCHQLRWTTRPACGGKGKVEAARHAAAFGAISLIAFAYRVPPPSGSYGYCAPPLPRMPHEPRPSPESARRPRQKRQQCSIVAVPATAMFHCCR